MTRLFVLTAGAVLPRRMWLGVWAAVAAPGSLLRTLPHWLVPLAAYAVVAGLVVARFGDRLL
ncbi:hypothetical protein ACFWG6_35740 [Streptomyces erythrochromogenes]|uniref:hypothetical protein n=1 Tax=Streptomyces erythrochromogenes TaxID=285574 RepID=UPI0004CD6F03|nr:hypothetical protein [Streptomyces erythrochromogenes]